jgi:Rps23 Pro-64 3,4-dihydroxylase Tpa1-like proline 4-hydroxylase
MKYEIFNDPIPHIIVDDWLPWAFTLKIINEISNLRQYLRPSKVNSGEKTGVMPALKSSNNLWLFQHYSANSSDFNLATFFEENFWSLQMREIIKETDDALFRTLLHTDSSQLLLSQYKETDHYTWHRDYSPTVTANYMIAKEPLKFNGGDFIFGDWDNKTALKTVEFKNNRLLLFPSRVWHKVTPVVNFKGSDIDARFTLQYWSKLKEIREI